MLLTLPSQPQNPELSAHEFTLQQAKDPGLRENWSWANTSYTNTPKLFSFLALRKCFPIIYHLASISQAYVDVIWV
jgi:hypothetical protein